MAQQVEGRQWLVSPRGGLLHYQREASLKSAPVLGVDATYFFTPTFGVGTTLSVARSNTRGEDFLAALNFGIPSDGDTTLYFGVTQPVTLFDVGLLGTARMPLGRFTPFLVGGLGVYTLYLNPQVNASPRRLSNMSANIGGGVDLLLGKSGSVQLGLRDLILTRFRRDFLNPSEPRFFERRFAEDLPAPPAAKNTVHNLQLTVGFSFRPGTSSSGGDQ
jgi:hypothetical protein